MEEINMLLNIEDLKIVQNTDWFKFSLDSVLLADFVKIENPNIKMIDFCTGNAPIPLLLSRKISNTILAVELQKSIFDLAVKSVKINNLENKIQIINKDVKDIINDFESDTFDLITCNPPYFKVFDKSLFTKNDIKSIARHEIEIKLYDIFKIAKKLLKNKGRISIVHRADRLIEIIESMKKNNIEPKRMRFVYPKYHSSSNIILIEGVKNGNSGIKIEPPLFVHNQNGNYLEEVKKMFE